MPLRACLSSHAFLRARPQRPPRKSRPIKVSARAKAACLPDALRLCRDAVPNVRNVLMCFGAHREQISNRCRTVLASYGLQ